MADSTIVHGSPDYVRSGELYSLEIDFAADLAPGESVQSSGHSISITNADGTAQVDVAPGSISAVGSVLKCPLTGFVARGRYRVEITVNISANKKPIRAVYILCEPIHGE
jgi:hypothetical protein